MENIINADINVNFRDAYFYKLYRKCIINVIVDIKYVISIYNSISFINFIFKCQKFPNNGGINITEIYTSLIKM